MDDRVERLLRQKLRAAGREFEAVKRAYREGMTEGRGLPTDDEGGVRIVCRRHAERRSVTLDSERRPDCFDPDHPDCRGCVEDIREGVVETW